MHHIFAKGLVVSVGLLLVLLVVDSCSWKFAVVKARPVVSTTEYTDPTESTDLPNEVDSLLRDGLLLFRAGQLDQAGTAFSRVVQIAPGNWSGQYYLGLVLTRQELYDSALVRLYAALDLTPDNPHTRSNIYRAVADNFERQGKLGQAEINYRMALNLFPESVPAREGLRRTQRLTQRTHL